MELEGWNVPLKVIQHPIETYNPFSSLCLRGALYRVSLLICV